VCALVFFFLSYQGLGLPRDPSPVLSPKTTVSYHHHIIRLKSHLQNERKWHGHLYHLHVCVCVCVCPRRPMHLHVQVQMGSLWKYERLTASAGPPRRLKLTSASNRTGGKRGQDGRQWTRGLNGMFPQRSVSTVETKTVCLTKLV